MTVFGGMQVAVLDLPRNLKRQSQRVTSFLTGDQRTRAGADAFDEVSQFFFERIGFRDVDFFSMNVAVFFGINLGFLCYVVQRNIGVILKNTDVANHVRCDTAGGEIADGVIGETDTGVGDVFSFGKNESTDGVDMLYRGFDQIQNNIDVVYHEIERHAHVRHTRVVRPEAVAFNEAGILDDVFDGAHGGIETFDMANLDETLIFFGQAEYFISIGESRRDGFFNQKMHAILQKVLGNLKMFVRWHDNTGSVDEF